MRSVFEAVVSFLIVGGLGGPTIVMKAFLSCHEEWQGLWFGWLVMCVGDDWQGVCFCGWAVPQLS